MNRTEIVTVLQNWIKDWAIDPHDARLILAECEDGIDRETLADYLDGQGYPNLAEIVNA